MTSYQGELPVLYRNMGNGTLEDVTVQTGAGDGSFPYVNWGTGLVDFDNDGDLDIFIACGHLQDNIDLFDDTSAYHVRNILLANTGDRKFVNVSDSCGDGMSVELSSRGAGFDDLDNDGRLDLLYTARGSGYKGDLATWKLLIRQGLGNWKFGPALEFEAGKSAYYIETADLNNDGNYDFVTAQYGSPAIEDLPYNGSNPYYIYVNFFSALIPASHPLS